MKLVGVSAVAVVFLACACSPVEVDEPKSPVASISPTQFAPPPTPITDDVPTAAQLTALFAASVDYSIREEDRARLFDGPAENNVRLARAWGAQPDPQHIEFTTVASTGPDSVEAMGVGMVRSMEGYPVGPIPFIRYDNQWRVPRDVACRFVGAFDDHEACK
ncbi:hypothetical protein [Rhodococcoides fascians]|uniref:hypothetical protein n=1 Tax=Rhodococcoides fascians TaxID=1828 RepID=UPI0006906920|nr:hypothetical protein [Rhodococcus fascians]